MMNTFNSAQHRRRLCMPSFTLLAVVTLTNIVAYAFSSSSVISPTPPLAPFSHPSRRHHFSTSSPFASSLSSSSSSVNNNSNSKDNSVAATTTFEGLSSVNGLSSASINGLKNARGGAAVSTSVNGANDMSSDSNGSGVGNVLASIWGTGGVLYILAKAIKRVMPIALEPFQKGAGVTPLSQVQLGIYIFTCAWFAYVEGYKGFQKKFSPLVVRRSQTLLTKSGSSNPVHLLLAPLYSMGLIHATKKRKIVSWSVTLGVATVVAIVKRLPYPWRNIIDAGVVAGLSYGSLSIVLIALKSAITKQPPAIDPALPTKTLNTVVNK